MEGHTSSADGSRPIYGPADLHGFCCRVLELAGAPAFEAMITADALLYADLRGIDSHGITLLPRYADYLKKGAYTAKRSIVTVRDSPSTALLDAGNGLGPPAAYKAMQTAIHKATLVGSACVAVRHSSHYGAAGYYARLALPYDMIGLCTTNSGPVVLPTFGLQRVLGTNPLAVAVPTGSDPALVLDMATSIRAGGKLTTLAREGKQTPADWVWLADGTPTRDPTVISSLYAGDCGGMLPLGGAGEETSGYKGFGLGLVVELLSTVLSGDVPSPFMELRPGYPEPSVGHFFSAIRIDAFQPAAEFKAEVDRLLSFIRASAKAPGQSRIYTPGEKEHECELQRTAHGVPLHPAVVESLQRLAQESGAEFPQEASKAEP